MAPAPLGGGVPTVFALQTYYTIKTCSLLYKTEVRWLDQERDSLIMDHFEGKGGLGGNGGRGGDGGDAADLFLPFEYNLVENNLDEVTIELLVCSSLSRLFSLLVLHVVQNSNKLFLMLSSPV